MKSNVIYSLKYSKYSQWSLLSKKKLCTDKTTESSFYRIEVVPDNLTIKPFTSKCQCLSQFSVYKAKDQVRSGLMKTYGETVTAHQALTQIKITFPSHTGNRLLRNNLAVIVTRPAWCYIGRNMTVSGVSKLPNIIEGTTCCRT